MKKLLLAALFAMGATGTYAVIRNVSNSPSAPVNPPFTYNDLPSAIAAASDGDSLYVHGTNIDYGNITITNKTLTLIGAGYGNNLQSNFQQKTYMSSLQFAGFTGTKNVAVIGIYFPATYSIITTSGGAVQNLLIERCGLQRITCQVNNLTIIQSILEEECQTGVSIFSPTVNSSAIIRNSVLSGTVNGGNVLSSLWENNIFKRTCSNNYGDLGTYNGSAIFNNNIFNTGYTVSVANCTFSHNLFVTVSGLGNGNTDISNIFSSSAPIFVNNAGATTNIGPENYCGTVDYHLTSGSAAIAAGIGGADLGVYGGTYALPSTAILNGVPAMPRITEMNVQNLSVSPTGTLNVQIKAVKEN